jgi:hypothetical protein
MSEKKRVRTATAQAALKDSQKATARASATDRPPHHHSQKRLQQQQQQETPLSLQEKMGVML